MKRLFVEKKPAFRSEAEHLLRDLQDSLRLPGLKSLRILQRYDVEGASEAAIRQAIPTVFAEPPVDDEPDDVLGEELAAVPPVPLFAAPPAESEDEFEDVLLASEPLDAFESDSARFLYESLR